MPLVRIDSLDDPRVSVYRDLPQANLTRSSGLFVAEGRFLVERLLQSHYRVHSLLVDERRISLLPENSDELPVYVVAGGLIEELVGFTFHRGVLACGYREPVRSLHDWCGPEQQESLLVACADVQDATNLGGILRNCAAFGVTVVAVSQNCADPFTRRVVRVSMGAALRLTILESADLLADLQQLREAHNYEVVGAVCRGGEQLAHARRQSRTALVVGNEAHGLSEEMIEFMDRAVTIPMSMETDSLNAAVATGVMLYHFSQVAVSD